MNNNHDQVYSAVIARVCLFHITKADEAINCIGDVQTVDTWELLSFH